MPNTGSRVATGTAGSRLQAQADASGLGDTGALSRGSGQTPGGQEVVYETPADVAAILDKTYEIEHMATAPPPWEAGDEAEGDLGEFGGFGEFGGLTDPGASAQPGRGPLSSTARVPSLEDEPEDAITLSATKKVVSGLQTGAMGTLGATGTTGAGSTMGATGVQGSAPPPGSVTASSPAIEDFIRNFLSTAGLVRTLEVFQSEWLEASARNGLPASAQFTPLLPDALGENNELYRKVRFLETRCRQLEESANRARATYAKLRRERDFHKAHHRQAYQEKQIIINDLRRLREHCALYEPLIKDLTEKCDATARQKMLMAIQRDRYETRVKALEDTLTALRGEGAVEEFDASLKPKPRREPDPLGYRSKKLGEVMFKPGSSKMVGARTDSHAPKDSSRLVDSALAKQAFPSDAVLRKLNPLVVNGLSLADFECLSDGSVTMQAILSVHAHDAPVTSVDLHSNRPVFATGSADGSWRVYSSFDSPGSPGQVLVSGSGHGDYITSARFCPCPEGQSLLATTSADGATKVWNIMTQRQLLELRQHKGVVWDCSWHCTGKVLATCGQDGVVRLWDVGCSIQEGQEAQEAQQRRAADGREPGASLASGTSGTSGMGGSMSGSASAPAPAAVLLGSLRGHKGPVTMVRFQPYGNFVLTASPDKTVRVWDPRSLTCVRQYTWNLTNACKATWSLDGCLIGAADADGHACVYNMQTTTMLVSLRICQCAINDVAFDRSASSLLCSCADGVVRVLSVADKKVATELPLQAGGECMQSARTSAAVIVGTEGGDVAVYNV